MGALMAAMAGSSRASQAKVALFTGPPPAPACDQGYPAGQTFTVTSGGPAQVDTPLDDDEDEMRPGQVLHLHAEGELPATAVTVTPWASPDADVIGDVRALIYDAPVDLCRPDCRSDYRFGTVLQHNMSACTRALAVGMGGCEQCRWIVTADDLGEDPAWELGAGSGLPPGSEPVDYGDSRSRGRGMDGDPCGP